MGDKMVEEMTTAEKFDITMERESVAVPTVAEDGVANDAPPFAEDMVANEPNSDSLEPAPQQIPATQAKQVRAVAESDAKEMADFNADAKPVQQDANETPYKGFDADEGLIAVDPEGG